MQTKYINAKTGLNIIIDYNKKIYSLQCGDCCKYQELNNYDVEIRVNANCDILYLENEILKYNFKNISALSKEDIRSMEYIVKKYDLCLNENNSYRCDLNVEIKKAVDVVTFLIKCIDKILRRYERIY